jgi:hypothetical protein
LKLKWGGCSLAVTLKLWGKVTGERFLSGVTNDKGFLLAEREKREERFLTAVRNDTVFVRQRKVGEKSGVAAFLSHLP